MNNLILIAAVTYSLFGCGGLAADGNIPKNPRAMTEVPTQYGGASSYYEENIAEELPGSLM